MKKVLKKLVELQQNYEIFYENNKFLRDKVYIHSLKKLKNNFKIIKDEYMSKKQLIEENVKKSTKLSEDINSNKKEIEATEDKLYAHCGSNLKLIDKYEKQIKDQKIAIKTMEDKYFELVEKEDMLKKEKENLKEKLTNLKEEFDTYKKDAARKIEEAKKNIEEAKKKIDVLQNEIPKDVLEKYNLIRKAKRRPVVPVKDKVCCGCKLELSMITLDKIKKRNEIVYCDNCGRIIYLP